MNRVVLCIQNRRVGNDSVADQIVKIKINSFASGYFLIFLLTLFYSFCVDCQRHETSLEHRKIKMDLLRFFSRIVYFVVPYGYIIKKFAANIVMIGDNFWKQLK